MPSLGTVDLANPTTGSTAWAGGQGEFACKGTRTSPDNIGQAVSVILEDDVTGEFQPSGDAILKGEGQRITFVLPAGVNIRARLSGGDAATSLEAFAT